MMKGTVMFASLLQRDSRAHAPNIEPKPRGTFPQNETLAVACWGALENGIFGVAPRPSIAYWGANLGKSVYWEAQLEFSISWDLASCSQASTT